MKFIKKSLCLLLAFVLTAGLFAIQPVQAQSSAEFKIHFLDVGSADAAILQYGTGASARYAMIDAGLPASGSSRSVAHDYLISHGITHLEFVLLTHPHRDHIGGMISILADDSITVDRIYGNPLHLNYSSDSGDTEFSKKDWLRVRSAIEKRIDEGSTSYIVPVEGDVITLGEAKITFFGTLINYNFQYERSTHMDMRQINKYSIVCKVVYKNNSFLMTGDAQKETIQTILQRGYDITAQVLKVPHHGFNDVLDKDKIGNYTSDHALVIEQSHASISVISNGFKNKGTPKRRLLRDLSHTDVYQTSDRGNITITSDGDSLSTSTSRGSSSPSHIGTISNNRTPLLKKAAVTSNLNRKIKLLSTGAKNKYPLVSSKNVILNFSAVPQDFTSLTGIEYKFVPKGTSSNSVSFQSGSSLTLKNGQQGVVYVRYSTTLGSHTVKLPGITVDTEAPTNAKVSGNKKIRLLDSSAATTYSLGLTSTVKLRFSAKYSISGKSRIQYKIVPKGKSAKNYKWKNGKRVTYSKKGQKVCIYVRFIDNAGNITVRKTNGFYIKRSKK